MAKVNDTDMLENLPLEDEASNEPEQEDSVPDAPAPPSPADTNPLWPKIEEEQFNHLTLYSEAYPDKRILLHYPTKREEVQIRGMVRRLSAELDVSPEELDVWSQNNFYVASLLTYACDNDKPVNWMEISPSSRKAEEALDATVTMIINWRFLFEDTEKAG